MSDSGYGADARAAREQAEIDRLVAQGARALALQQTARTDGHNRAAALCERLAVTAGNLAATEDEVARVHDELAALRPHRSREHRRVADEARQGAVRARLMEDNYRKAAIEDNSSAAKMSR